MCFRAAIVAIQRGSKPPTGRLGEVRFEKNDVLLLQVGDDSPLLTKEYFDATNDYKQQGGGRMSRNTSRDDLAGSQHKTGLGNMVRRMTGTLSRNSSNNSLGEKEAGGVGEATTDEYCYTQILTLESLVTRRSLQVRSGSRSTKPIGIISRINPKLVTVKRASTKPTTSISTEAVPPRVLPR